jgi:hypothetical protein
VEGTQEWETGSEDAVSVPDGNILVRKVYIKGLHALLVWAPHLEALYELVTTVTISPRRVALVPDWE